MRIHRPKNITEFSFTCFQALNYITLQKHPLTTVVTKPGNTRHHSHSFSRSLGKRRGETCGDSADAGKVFLTYIAMNRSYTILTIAEPYLIPDFCADNIKLLIIFSTQKYIFQLHTLNLHVTFM